MRKPIPILRLTPVTPEENAFIDRRGALERRLGDGFERIDQAIATGEDVQAWEDFWVRLLREYEAICNDLEAAA
jgi:hypothetical protein